MKRKATITRDTRETQIRLTLGLDGTPDGNKIATGVPFNIEAAERGSELAKTALYVGYRRNDYTNKTNYT